jgi:hypothetical protein
MIGMVWRLVVGSFHQHAWETINVNPLSTDYGSTGHRYTLRCTKCGHVKKRDLI